VSSRFVIASTAFGRLLTVARLATTGDGGENVMKRPSGAVGRGPRRRTECPRWITLLALLMLLGQGQAALATIAYVQSNSTSPNNPSLTSLSTTFTAAQGAGDLNVVAVAWGTNASISSLTDTAGNTYTLAVQSTVSGLGMNAIYYAQNIVAAAAGANTVTVTFSAAVGDPDIRVAEYSGISTTSPLDVTVAATGSGTLTNSGPVTTTNANDLLVGANLVGSTTTGPGTGFTQRVISGEDGDILEDEIVSAVGSYSATAPISPSGTWIMQMAAFKAAGGADTSPPTAPSGLTATTASSTQINLTWTASTDNVGVTGYLVERCQGSGCTSFAQIATPTTTSYNDTGLPAATSYMYRVRATDAAGNLSAYSNSAGTTTPASGIAYVQSNSTSPNNPSLTNLSTTFTAAQRAGDLNVVAVAWGTNASISSLTDTAGNTYTLAVGPTVFGGQNAIYYAKNIVAAAAGANTVTVTFSAAVGDPDIRVAEYSGISTTSPLDVTVAATGSGTLTNSGSVTTTNANDLLVGANLVGSTTTGPGTGFTQRVISGEDGDILEDEIVSTVGAYSATAPISPSGTWIMQMAAFKAAGSANTTPPTAPSGLASPASSDSQINLSWTASTDNVGVTGYLVERCLGSGCSTFTQIATSKTVTYIDTGVSASASYNYRVRATDASNNLSNYSNTVAASTKAATAYTCPSTGLATVCYFYDEASRLKALQHDDGARQTYVLDPAGNRLSTPGVAVSSVTKPVLTVAARSATSMNLSWSPPTGGNGNFTYVVNRGAQALPGVTTTSIIDTGLSPHTSYTYVLIATDSDGNTAQSDPVSGTTYTNPVVSTFTASSSSSGSIILTWAASDSGGPAGNLTYSVTRGSTSLPGCSASPCTDSGLAAGTSYTYTLTATDSAGDTTTSTTSGQTYSLSVISSFVASPITASSMTLSWSATDTGGPTGNLTYSVRRGSTPLPGCTTSPCTDSGLTAGTSYTYTLTVTDAAGDTATATTSRATYSLPVISSFVASPATASSMTLSWSVTDTGGPTGNLTYSVRRGSTSLPGCTTSPCTDSGLTAGTSYTYTLTVTDAAGDTTTATTSRGTYSLPVISSFVAPSATASSVTLSWSATDTGGPTGNLTYSVRRGSTSLPGCTTSPCTDSGLAAGTSYTYTLTATDAAGDTATATTSRATYSLPVISSFVASPATASSMTLSWSATDTGGPTGNLTYSVMRGSTAIACSASPCTDTGLTPGASYSYTLTAKDSVGDTSAASASSQTYSLPTASLSVGSVTASSVALSYSSSDTGGPGLAYIRIYNGSTLFVQSDTTSAGATQTGLSANTTYSYSLYAYDTAGDVSAASTVNVTTGGAESATLTAGFVYYGAEGTGVGFALSAPSFGSISPTTLRNGIQSYYYFTDTIGGNLPGGGVAISGFSADPGSGWLISATAGAITRQGTAAAYIYSNGVAQWFWGGASNQFGLPSSGTVSVSLVHH
jgi:chitodextrinase